MLPGWTTKYFLLALFVAMISVGEISLIPGIYLGWVIPHLTLFSLLVVTLLGSIVSDSFWYFVGKYFPRERLMKYRFFRREYERAQKMKPMYERHKLRMIFYSKFMYGTTVFFQVLAGANGLSYRAYIAASTMATIVWFLAATVLVFIVDASIGDLKSLVIGIEIIATATLVTALLSYGVVCWIAKRKFTRSRQM